jgi:hypothetical protein
MLKHVDSGGSDPAIVTSLVDRFGQRVFLQALGDESVLWEQTPIDGSQGDGVEPAGVYQLDETRGGGPFLPVQVAPLRGINTGFWRQIAPVNRWGHRKWLK